MTPLAFLSVASFFLTSWYVLFLLRVILGLRQRPRPSIPKDPEFASVILAVRNEESHITACLESLLAQDYPSRQYEVVVIDDGSTDGTPGILRRFAEVNRHVRVIIRKAEGKRAALAVGIEHAKGDILLFTDGDCVVRPGWLKAMASGFSGQTKLVAGVVVQARAGGLLARLSRLEFLGLIGVAAGLIRSGRPIFCNGANLAYRKSHFLLLGGFGSARHFSDDEAILQQFHQSESGSVTFLLDPTSHVTTRAARNFREFWAQRVRWASKSGVYPNKTILLELTCLYLFFVLTLALLVLSILDPSNLSLLIPVVLAKLVADWLVLRSTAGLLHEKLPIPEFFVAELLHVPYIVFAALQGQTWTLRWKGESVPR